MIVAQVALAVVLVSSAALLASTLKNLTKADVGLSITGVAGPDPLEGKPPGTVYIGVATATERKASTGGIVLRNRPDVRQRSTANALLFLRRCLLGLA